MMLATTPVTCPSGTAAIERSAAVSLQARDEHHRRMDDVAMREHRALRLARGARGVEDHRGVFFADLGRRCRRRVVGEFGKARELRIVIDRDAMRQVGNVARIRQAIGQRGLVDQQLCAAIGQHIGDLGLLLAGREQHRHQPGMRRGEHRQHEFDAVAEQHRDAVAALQAELAKSGRDLRRLLRDLAPGHSPCRRRPAPRHRDFAPRHPRPSPRCFWAARKTPAPRGRRSAPRAASAGMECCDQSIGAPRQLLLHAVDMLGPGKARERTSVA